MIQDCRFILLLEFTNDDELASFKFDGTHHAF